MSTDFLRFSKFSLNFSILLKYKNYLLPREDDRLSVERLSLLEKLLFGLRLGGVFPLPIKSFLGLEVLRLELELPPELFPPRLPPPLESLLESLRGGRGGKSKVAL